LEAQHSSRPDQQAPALVGADFELFVARRAARDLERVFVFAGRQLDLRAIRRSASGASLMVCWLMVMTASSPVRLR
jgi:hypothetical protein